MIDVPLTMYRITTAVTARRLFAAHERASSLPVHASMDIVTKGVARRIMMPVPGADRIPTPANRRYRRAQTDLRALTHQLIADYRADDTPHHDLLSMLLAARDDNGRGLSDDEIHDQVITFLLAGMETTAGLLSWIWHLLARRSPPPVLRPPHPPPAGAVTYDRQALRMLYEIPLPAQPEFWYWPVTTHPVGMGEKEHTLA